VTSLIFDHSNVTRFLVLQIPVRSFPVLHFQLPCKSLLLRKYIVKIKPYFQDANSAVAQLLDIVICFVQNAQPVCRYRFSSSYATLRALFMPSSHWGKALHIVSDLSVFGTFKYYTRPI